MRAKIPNLAKLQLADYLAPRAGPPGEKGLKLCLHSKQTLLVRFVYKVPEAWMCSKCITQRYLLGNFDDLGVKNVARIMRS